MSSNTAILASISDYVGSSGYAEAVAPRLVTYAQQQDWAGRSILYLGIGMGAVTRSFLTRQFGVTIIEDDADTLAQLREAFQLNADFYAVEGDLRSLSKVELGLRPDMVMCLGEMNHLAALRDFESVFKSVNERLSPGKFFIFDLHTLRGLTELGQASDSLIVDESNLAVFRQNTYDFERQACSLRYHIFRKAGDDWQRDHATDTLRGYPVQAVATLAKRHNLELVGVLDSAMREFDLNDMDVTRVFFVMKKQ